MDLEERLRVGLGRREGRGGRRGELLLLLGFEELFSSQRGVRMGEGERDAEADWEEGRVRRWSVVWIGF